MHTFRLEQGVRPGFGASGCRGNSGQLIKVRVAVEIAGVPCSSGRYPPRDESGVDSAVVIFERRGGTEDATGVVSGVL